MAVTTFGAMRGTMNTQIEALTPTTGSAEKFLRHQAHVDFREWAQDTPIACTRRFHVKNLNVYDDVQVSNLDEVLEPGRCEVVVAYQTDYRWGDSSALEDVIEQDRAAIDAVVGINATAYTNGCTYQPDFAIEETGAVTFLVLQYTFVFYRSV